MIKRDFHTHTAFCDGRDTPEETVLSAIKKGMDAIGFSAHSYTFFDESYCMKKEEIAAYRAEILRLKEAYADRIRIFLGIEQDLYSKEPTDGFEYVIGSVHYLKIGEEYLPVDETEEILKKTAKTHFGGDLISLAECYFETVSQLSCIHPNIIGHFDLVTKFNENGRLFDENDPRYIAAWRSAADALLTLHVPFEVNTGAIARGVRSTPYPSPKIIEYIRSRGGTVILSSDAHRKEDLCYAFLEWEAFLHKRNVPITTLSF